jgi:hypothetical protein
MFWIVVGEENVQCLRSRQFFWLVAPGALVSASWSSF